MKRRLLLAALFAGLLLLAPPVMAQDVLYPASNVGITGLTDCDDVQECSDEGQLGGGAGPDTAESLCFPIGAPEALEVFPNLWRVPEASTITEAWCITDNGGSSVLMDFTVNGSDVAGTDIACDDDGQAAPSLGGVTALVDGDRVGVAFTTSDDLGTGLYCIDYTQDNGQDGGNEANTISLAPSAVGASLVKGKVGIDHQLKGIIGGTGITVTAGADDLTIDADAAGFTDIDTDYGDENVTSTWNFTDVADHQWSTGTTDLDLGDADEGQIRLGNAYIGQADETISSLVLDDILVLFNTADSVEDIGMLFISSANVPRFVIAEEGADLATYNPRSMIIGPAATLSNVDDNILCSTNFLDIDCDTAGSGADLGVMDDIELGGAIYSQGIDDDDCTGQIGAHWYDSTDTAFEFCEADSGVPATLGGGGEFLFATWSNFDALSSTGADLCIALQMYNNIDDNAVNCNLGLGTNMVRFMKAPPDGAIITRVNLRSGAAPTGNCTTKIAVANVSGAPTDVPTLSWNFPTGSTPADTQGGSEDLSVDPEDGALLAIVNCTGSGADIFDVWVSVYLTLP